MTLILKKCCLRAVITLGLNSLSLWPLVELPDSLVKIISGLMCMVEVVDDCDFIGFN